MGIFVNKYGNNGTTALEAATNGLAAMSQVDSKTLDQTLKLFGGFDRNTFKQVTAQTTQTLPSIQEAADYPRPARLLKEHTEYDSMGTYGEVVKNLNDPRFNVSDGLASFSRNGIGNVLNSLEEKGIIINGGKPDNKSATQQNADPEPLMYIYPFRYMQTAVKGLEPGPDDGKAAVPVPDDNKAARVIIDDDKNIAVGDLNNVLNGQIPSETRNAFVEDILLKLQKMQDTTMQQLKLHQDLKFSKGIGFEY